MPRKSKRYYSTKKRRSARKAMYRGARRGKKYPYAPLRLTMKSGGLTDSAIIKFRYSQAFTLDPSDVFESASRIYSANSLYDPDVTGTGHQPYLYDFWSQVYSKYTVTGARCVMYPEYQNSGNLTPGTFGIIISKDTTLPATWNNDQFYETVNGVGTKNKMGGTIQFVQAGNSRARVVKNFSARKFLGIKDPTDGNTYSGLTGNLGTGSSPATQVYFLPYYLSNGVAGSANDPSATTFRVIIDYIAVLQDVKLNSGS